ncbi:hypothetical protein D9619_013301 [Psilocybe cf. subviscida]|uniref:Uncharacterized protein n=1 Tax=Psilocybe cf. subviscida TaxID=2480587 RepID=A0A8H5F967_9AGAR|nr:hypothetical protein D9619_013301 [Psilocybe cf. subviscida]
MDGGGLLRLDTAYATGFVVETGLYSDLSSAIIGAGFFPQGIYTCLFIGALPGMTSARRLKDAHSAKSAWVFLTFSTLIPLHPPVLAAFRFYKSIFLNVDPNGAIPYLNSWNHWEYFPLIVQFCVQTWLGDVLVIYRCYFVWGRRLLFILFPVCLLLASIGTNLTIWYWIYHPSSISPTRAMRIFDCIYPLAFVQNFMTTSLIIVKIFLQHRTSREAGIVQLGSTLSLMRVVRIVVESAAIYTIELLVLIILYFRNDNAQYVVQAAINPSIGITFVLLAIRIQPSRPTSAPTGNGQGITSTLIPQWLQNAESDIESSDQSSEGQHNHFSDPTYPPLEGYFKTGNKYPSRGLMANVFA